MTKYADHIHPIFDQLVSREERARFFNHSSAVFWLTGLSGSGKSTVAKGTEKALFDQGFHTVVLDGDNVRAGINNNLLFSLEDRKENIRRIAEVAKLMMHSGAIVICSFISPTRDMRSLAKEIIGPADFLEVFIKTSVETCESRDVKGLYKKARAGEIKGFTGVDSPYEEPLNPHLVIHTEKESVEDSIKNLTSYIAKRISIK